MRLAFILWIALNIRAFIMFGEDKHRAIIGSWRIPEQDLLFTAMTGGVGAYAGMQVFHHKTVKGNFPVLVPIFAAIHVIAAAILFF